MTRSELGAVGFLVLFAAGLLVLDAAVPTAERPPPRSSGPLISAGWYCPSPGGQGVDPAMSAVNLGNQPVKLRRLAVGNADESASVETKLGARRKDGLALSRFGVPDAVGLTEAFGSAITAELSLVSPQRGVGSSRCSSQAGDRWLFANAGTARREDNYLLVANPFQEEAVMRVRVMEPGREVLPARLKDFVIPALSQISVFLSEYVPETPSFGVEVVATQGRIVVSRYVQVATRDGVRGAALDIGARAPAVSWAFAGGEVPADGEETLVIVNPGAKESLVQVIFQTENEQVAPEPLNEVPVPAGRQVGIKVSDFLPRGAKHATRLLSTNDIGVVVERKTIAAVAGGRGYESVFGVPKAARRWAVAVGSAAEGSDSIALVNSGKTSTKVTVSLLAGATEVKPAELRWVQIPPDRRRTVDLTPFIPAGGATALVSSSSAPIAVENLLTLGPPYADFASSPGDPVTFPAT